MRIHGDLHLGQLLRLPDGYQIIDFEGDPLLPLEQRRALASPLRDVATMIRSLDHVASSARRRATLRAGGPLGHVGLDLDAWFDRARARFLAAYRRGLRSVGSPIDVDEALLHAFELDKECLETTYAATFLPSWLEIATAGMQRVVAHSGPR